MPATTTQKGTLTPEATKGLEYLKTINPQLAASIQQNFSPASAAPIDASTIGATSNISVPFQPDIPVPTIVMPPIVNTDRQNALDQEAGILENDIATDTEKLGTKSARQAELERQQGIPQLNADIQELYDQATQLDADVLSATNKSEDRRAPMFAIRGEQAQIQREASVRKAGIAALASAKQGKLALAQDYVTKALAAEFDPLIAAIDAKKFRLEVNRDKFKGEEARAQEERARLLDQQKEALAQAREDRKNKYDIMLTAAQYGADNQTLQRIQLASSAEEAARIASPILGTKFADDKAQQQFENNIKLAQLAIDQAKLKNDAGAASADPATLLAYAQQYAATGQIPTGIPKGSFGIISQIGKELPKADGTLVSSVTGIAPNTLSATQTDGIVALRDLQKKLDDAKVLFNSYNHGILAGIKNAVLPSVTSQQYNNLRGEIVDLLARARSGAALTANEEATYLKKLPGNFSNSLFLGSSGNTQIDSLQSSITGKLNTALQTNNLAIYGYSTVNIGGQQFVVGQTVTNSNGQTGRVNADGTITLTQ